MSYINNSNKENKDDEEENKKTGFIFSKVQEFKENLEFSKRVKEVKKKIKKIKSMDELEDLASELEDEGILESHYIDKLKKKKKKKLEEAKSFFERIRADQSTINRIEKIMENFKQEVRERQKDKDLIQNRDERDLPGSKNGQKEKQKEKGKGERTRESGGRSRGSR